MTQAIILSGCLKLCVLHFDFFFNFISYFMLHLQRQYVWMVLFFFIVISFYMSNVLIVSHCRGFPSIFKKKIFYFFYIVTI